METVVETLNVPPDFLTILLAAGDQPRQSEAGFGHPVETTYEDGSFCKCLLGQKLWSQLISVAITYLFRYPEKRKTKWRKRQTGIYHGYCKAEQSHTFVLLHPNLKEDSIFQAQLEACVGKVTPSGGIANHPMALHKILFESYIGNWRPFLGEQGVDFIENVSILL